jgi:cysteine desulfurase/selenocysteine lyase
MEGIAIRTGHHCCEPVMKRMCVPATARASLAAYNTREDVDAMVGALKKLVDGHVRSAKPQAASSQEVVYPKPSAASPAEAAEEIVETFELFGSREEKTEYLQDDLGQKLPHYFDLLKQIPGARVTGCVAEVYLVARRAADDPHRLEFIADANAEVVRGLIALMQRVFSGQNVDQILAFDVEAFFRRLGLDQFITQQRRNGLAGMVKRIHAEASKQ